MLEGTANEMSELGPASPDGLITSRTDAVL
jgi:hypothetical protein